MCNPSHSNHLAFVYVDLRHVEFYCNISVARSKKKKKDLKKNCCLFLCKRFDNLFIFKCHYFLL